RIFSIYTPHLRRAPLFPYTTLFRSHGGRRDLLVAVVAVDIEVEAAREAIILSQRRRGEDGGRRITGLLQPLRQQRDLWREGEVIDRKSTRLNSSHVSISYAVFCLKK